MQPPPPPQPPKRRGLLALGTGRLIALGVTLVVLLGAGFIAVLVVALGIGRDGPDSAVKEYFAALADGDAEKALRHTYEGTGAAKDNPLLTSAALTDPARRPSAVTISKARALSGAKSWRAVAAYVANGKDVNMIVTIRQIDGKYVVLEAFTALRVTPGVQGLTVNGVAVPAAGETLTVFPGSYQVKAAGNALLAEVDVMADQAGGSYASASIFSRELAPGVQAEVDKQVRAKLDGCMKSTSDAPPGCPFRAFLPGEKPSVRWTMPTYPKVEVSSVLTSESASARFSGSGVAHYEADYRDFFGAKKHEADNDQIYVYGNVTVKDSKLVVTFTN
ncbi:hypothetical protein [Actinoplanes sp. NPDC026619]|uniref:hypothetical protein n=1 Tax=Actinoplanes sp. NPDC026619 TaxID=3155798 RepID=UPI0033FFAA51